MSAGPGEQARQPLRTPADPLPRERSGAAPARQDPTNRERDRIWSEYMEMLASGRRISSRLPGAGVAARLLLGVGLAATVVVVLMALFDVPSWLRATAIGVILGAVLVTVVLLTTGLVGPRRRIYWAAQRRCGHDLCVVCGYRLDRRAAGSHSCPECGTDDADQPVPLGARLADPAWPRFEPDPPEDANDPHGDRLQRHDP